MLARLEWIKDISVAATRGKSRAVKDGLSGTTLYVPPVPVYKKLVSKRERELIVADVISILKRGRFSVFEHEAAVRYGLRLRFIGEGHSWAHADMESAAILDRAFLMMGAARPSWESGQANWTISHDFCQTCHSPLDDADTAGHRRFCSDNCARIMKSRNVELHYRINHGIRNHAIYAARLSEVPERPCTVCGAGFKSVDPEAKTCSPACAGAAKRTVEERPCAHCGARFRPHSITKAGVYCSPSCASASRRLKPKPCSGCAIVFQPASRHDKYCCKACKPGLPDVACGQCGEAFQPATKAAVFCSRKCKDTAINRRRALDAEAARAFFACQPC